MIPSERDDAAHVKQVAVEQDPKKFIELVVELNRLLEEKQGRLNGMSRLKRPQGEATQGSSWSSLQSSRRCRCHGLTKSEGTP